MLVYLLLVDQDNNNNNKKSTFTFIMGKTKIETIMFNADINK